MKKNHLIKILSSLIVKFSGTSPNKVYKLPSLGLKMALETGPVYVFFYIRIKGEVGNVKHA